MQHLESFEIVETNTTCSISDLLRSHRLGHFCAIFLKEGIINRENLLKVDEEQQRRLGLTKFERKHFEAVLDVIQKQGSHQEAQPEQETPFPPTTPNMTEPTHGQPTPESSFDSHPPNDTASLATANCSESAPPNSEQPVPNAAIPTGPSFEPTAVPKASSPNGGNNPQVPPLTIPVKPHIPNVQTPSPQDPLDPAAAAKSPPSEKVTAVKGTTVSAGKSVTAGGGKPRLPPPIELPEEGSRESSPAREEGGPISQAGVVGSAARLAPEAQEPMDARDAARVLACIALAGRAHCEVAVRVGAAPHLVRMLVSGSEQEQLLAAEAVGSMALDCDHNTFVTLLHSGVPQALSHITVTGSAESQKASASALQKFKLRDSYSSFPGASSLLHALPAEHHPAFPHLSVPTHHLSNFPTPLSPNATALRTPGSDPNAVRASAFSAPKPKHTSPFPSPSQFAQPQLLQAEAKAQAQAHHQLHHAPAAAALRPTPQRGGATPKSGRGSWEEMDHHLSGHGHHHSQGMDTTSPNRLRPNKNWTGNNNHHATAAAAAAGGGYGSGHVGYFGQEEAAVGFKRGRHQAEGPQHHLSTSVMNSEAVLSSIPSLVGTLGECPPAARDAALRVLRDILGDPLYGPAAASALLALHHQPAWGTKESSSSGPLRGGGGGAVWLVVAQLGRKMSPRTRARAAGCLCNLADHGEEAREVLMRVGAVPHLVAILNPPQGGDRTRNCMGEGAGVEGGKAAAAGCLCNLAWGSGERGEEMLAQAQDTGGGLVATALGLLRENSDSGVRKAAAGMLCNLASHSEASRAHIAAKGGTQALVRCLALPTPCSQWEESGGEGGGKDEESGGGGMMDLAEQEEAAKALTNLMLDSNARRDLAMRSGVLPALVALIRQGNLHPGPQQPAQHHHPQTQMPSAKRAAKGEGSRPSQGVACVEEPSSGHQQHSGSASPSATTSTSVLRWREAQTEAARCLWSLAGGSRGRRRAMLAHTSLLSHILAMLLPPGVGGAVTAGVYSSSSSSSSSLIERQGSGGGGARPGSPPGPHTQDMQAREQAAAGALGALLFREYPEAPRRGGGGAGGAGAQSSGGSGGSSRGSSSSGEEDLGGGAAAGERREPLGDPEQLQALMPLLLEVIESGSEVAREAALKSTDYLARASEANRLVFIQAGMSSLVTKVMAGSSGVVKAAAASVFMSLGRSDAHIRQALLSAGLPAAMLSPANTPSKTDKKPGFQVPNEPSVAPHGELNAIPEHGCVHPLPASGPPQAAAVPVQQPPPYPDAASGPASNPDLGEAGGMNVTSVISEPSGTRTNAGAKEAEAQPEMSSAAKKDENKSGDKTVGSLGTMVTFSRLDFACVPKEVAHYFGLRSPKPTPQREETGPEGEKVNESKNDSSVEVWCDVNSVAQLLQLVRNEEDKCTPHPTSPPKPPQPSAPPAPPPAASTPSADPDEKEKSLLPPPPHPTSGLEAQGTRESSSPPLSLGSSLLQFLLAMVRNSPICVHLAVAAGALPTIAHLLSRGSHSTKRGACQILTAMIQHRALPDARMLSLSSDDVQDKNQIASSDTNSNNPSCERTVTLLESMFREGCIDKVLAIVQEDGCSELEALSNECKRVGLIFKTRGFELASKKMRSEEAENGVNKCDDELRNVAMTFLRRFSQHTLECFPSGSVSSDLAKVMDAVDEVDCSMADVVVSTSPLDTTVA